MEALKLKFDSNQFVQTNPTSDHVPAKNFRAAIPDPKLQTKILIHLFLEESDLALIPCLVAEEPIAGDPFSGDALNLSDLDGGLVAGRLFVMTEVVVSGGNEQMKDIETNANHDCKHSVSRFLRKGDREETEARIQELRELQELQNGLADGM